MRLCSWFVRAMEPEAIMFEELTLAEAVGLKHVLEDGLAVLLGQPLAADRRDFVMRDLQTLLNQAIRGSRIASQSNLFLGEDDKLAFGSFALIDRYLGSSQAKSWLDQAPDALLAIERSRQEETPEEAQKNIALKILSALLTQIVAGPSSETQLKEAQISRAR
jgi:hypothetical protein